MRSIFVFPMLILAITAPAVLAVPDPAIAEIAGAIGANGESNSWLGEILLIGLAIPGLVLLDVMLWSLLTGKR